MFIFLFQKNHSIFISLNTISEKKILIEKSVKHKICIVAYIIDSDFEEL